MKTTVCLTAALLALTQTLAAAAGPSGLNLAWITSGPGHALDDCPGSPSMAVDAVDACDATANTTHYMAASLVAPPGITRATSEDVFINLQVANPVLDQYWHLEAGGCRYGRLATVSNSFALWDQMSCADYWDPNANFGGSNWVSGSGGPNRAQLEAIFAVPPTAAGPMTQGVEYYLIWALFMGGYGGLAQCTDCHDPGCFVLNETVISQPAYVGDFFITNPSIRQFVTWQGGANTNCPTATPTRRSTWGEMKSLYRN